MNQNAQSSITFVLPNGTGLSGAVAWSISTASRLAGVGQKVYLIEHVNPTSKLSLIVEPEVNVIKHEGTRPAVATETTIDEFIGIYASVAPSVIIPNWFSATYATCAKLLSQAADSLRVVGYAHSDEEYYYDLLSYHEPIISVFVAVSDEVARELALRMPHRESDILVKAYPVEVNATLDRTYSSKDGPIRLLYAGRLEDEQKRVSRLLDLATLLGEMGVDFVLSIAGDGSARSLLIEQARALDKSVRKRIRFLGRVPYREMTSVWRDADICVLVSDYEGTSVSMLEAMAQGCVPVVTRVSGVPAVIDQGNNGFMADVGDLRMLASFIGRLAQNRSELERLGKRAHDTVVAEYSYEAYIEWFAPMARDLWKREGRSWPAEKPLLPVRPVRTRWRSNSRLVRFLEHMKLDKYDITWKVVKLARRIRWARHRQGDDSGSVSVNEAGSPESMPSSRNLSTGVENVSPRLCIVAPTRDIYSETFIRAHIDRLPGNNDVIYSSELVVGGISRRKPGSRAAALLQVGRFIQRKMMGMPASEFRSRRLARTLTSRDYYALLAEYGDTGVYVMDACRKANVPLIVHFHGHDAYSGVTLQRAGKRYPKLFELAGAVIRVSRAMESELLGLGCPADKLNYIPYGVDLEKFGGAEPAMAAPNFLSVGRFVEKKAPYLAILAFEQVVRQVPNARLSMIGDGALFETCAAIARGRQLTESVSFLGSLPHQEVARLMQESRAFVQHSVRAHNGDSEGTPVAIIEAAASGLPVIATRHAGILDVVTEGKTGLLVDEYDVDGMARHMIRLAEDAELAGDIGRRARERAMEKFGIERSIDKLAKVIRRTAAVHERTARGSQ